MIQETTSIINHAWTRLVKNSTRPMRHMLDNNLMQRRYLLGSGISADIYLS
jgi:hypothetical protein